MSYSRDDKVSEQVGQGDDVDANYEDGLSYEDSQSEWVDEESLSDDEGLEAGGNHEAPPKKKKSKLTTIIIVVAVVVVAALFFLMMAGGGDPSQQAGIGQENAKPIIASEDPQTDQAPQKATQPVDTVSVENGGDLMGGDASLSVQSEDNKGIVQNPPVVSMDKTGGEQVVAAQNPALDQQIPAPEVEEPAPMTAPPTLGNIVNDVNPVSDFPTVDSIKKDNMVADMAKEEKPADVEVTVADQEAQKKLQEMQDRISTYEEKVGDLEKKLSEKDTVIQQLKSDSDAVNQDEISSLKVKIADLEEKLAAQKEAQDKPLNEVAAVPEKQAVKRVEVVRPAETWKKRATSTEARKWVLKSAVPGRAVIFDSASGDSRQITVGDVIAGIGKITSVTNSASGWIIEGTEGQLKE